MIIKEINSRKTGLYKIKNFLLRTKMAILLNQELYLDRQMPILRLKYTGMKQLRTIYRENKGRIWILCSMILMDQQILKTIIIQVRTFTDQMARDLTTVILKVIEFPQGREGIEVPSKIWEGRCSSRLISPFTTIIKKMCLSLKTKVINDCVLSRDLLLWVSLLNFYNYWIKQWS